MDLDFNPFSILLPEICELILQHVTGSELLLASEVSTTMYDYIAGSNQCMAKIKVKLYEKSIPDDVKFFLVSSGRKYENLELAELPTLVEAATKIMSAPGRNWKSVIIKCLDFETLGDVTDFLSIFESTVEQLSMNQVYVKSLFQRQQPHLFFPKLKRLETKCCQALLYREAFSYCTSLTEFSVKSGGEFYLDAIKNILRSNVGLTVLGIHFNIFNLMFAENIAGILRFSLKEFQANDLYRVAGCYAARKKNFHDFLLAQQDSIEVFSIGDWMGIEVMQTIFGMPCLKSLTMKCIHHAERYIDWDDMQLHQNKMIIKLDFKDILNNEKILETVLDATPNLKSLSIYSMDQKAMKLIGPRCPNLVSLSVEHLQATDFSDQNLFPNLQKFTYKKSWGRLQYSSSQPLTPFKKLVYKILQ